MSADIDVFARVCGDSGYVELFVEEPGTIYQAHVGSQRNSE